MDRHIHFGIFATAGQFVGRHQDCVTSGVTNDVGESVGNYHGAVVDRGSHSIDGTGMWHARPALLDCLPHCPAVFCICYDDHFLKAKATERIRVFFLKYK